MKKYNEKQLSKMHFSECLTRAVFISCIINL